MHVLGEELILVFHLKSIEIMCQECIGKYSSCLIKNVIIPIAAGNMREDQLSYASFICQLSHSLSGSMTKIFRHFSFFIEVSSLHN